MKQFLSTIGSRSWLLSFVLLALITVASLPSTAAAQTSDAQKYAQAIASDPGATNGGYLAAYWQIVNQGKPPLDAYRATYMYNTGYTIGYYYGVLQIINNNQAPADKYALYFTWVNYYQQAAWSQKLWGWFQQGYLDGQNKGFNVAMGKEAGRTDVIPAPTAGDVLRYQRSLGVDPNDPWSDLRVREQITGPK
jgi:hypothetical protein